LIAVIGRLCLLAMVNLGVGAGANAQCIDSDMNYFFKENYAFAESMKECSGLFGLDIDCFAATAPYMSAGCINCFAQMTSCTVSYCKGACMRDARGLDCKNCSLRYCGDAMLSCSGVSAEFWPDFVR
jgi:hypothetical protein